MNEAKNKVGYTVTVKGATPDEVMELNEIIAELDDVEKNAILALTRALARGEDHETAFAAGNAVLIAAGREPMPHYVLEKRSAG